MNIYSSVRELAKSIKYQNLLIATKEISSIRLFKNEYDLSKLQEIFLSYLYTYDMISKDIITEKISKHVTDNEIYEDSYLLWRKQKKDTEEKKTTMNDISLVAGKEIKFPYREA
jgi:hypothetical protein